MDPLTMALILGGSSIFESILGKAFFGPPKAVRRLTRQTAEKGSELLAHPGYGQDVIDAIFGKNFENIRGQASTQGRQRTETFGRAGMSGTGAEIKAARKDAWSNENLVTEAMRDLLISSEAKKSSDIQLAGQLLGQSTGAAQMQQGQGPALTEILLTAMLMGMKNKPALGAEDLGAVIPWYLQPGAPARDFGDILG